MDHTNLGTLASRRWMSPSLFLLLFLSLSSDDVHSPSEFVGGPENKLKSRHNSTPQIIIVNTNYQEWSPSTSIRAQLPLRQAERRLRGETGDGRKGEREGGRGGEGKNSSRSGPLSHPAGIMRENGK
ncbi:hypothetical protein E2C01_009010 [Portunus trituberculatus]|uniref:Uncharacterized protein n=1 Tax=Portunus trituberculatus TaxID=210409 RepID=A0A5B7D3J0_PORTR|nr:hypothetical protein [Portunus trituberculatus]